MRRTTSISLPVLTASLARALVNITVDDREAGLSIAFTSESCVALEPDGPDSSWEVSPGGYVHLCHSKTLRRCDEAGATVTFKFTGVAVYLLYPPWPHEMTLTATLDSNLPILFTIPARSQDVPVDLEAGVSSSQPVWGLSGLPNTEHTFTIGRPESGGVYLDAFMYTALCDAEPCDRRRRKGVGESEDDSGDLPAPASSSKTLPSSMSALSSTMPTFSSIASTSSPTSSTPTSSAPSTSSASTSAPPPTTDTSRTALPHRDDVGIALGTILAVLIIAIGLVFARRRYRRRRTIPDSSQEKPSPPYTASDISSLPTSGPERPPSMRERRDRFSYGHTPAGSPLTGTPASCLTSLSSNSMGLANLPGPSEKYTYSPSSANGTSIRDDESEARFEIPPPEYETPQ